MKRNRTLLFIAVVAVIGGGAFWLATNSRAATETPEYRVVRTDGKFEVRDYPALTVVGTPMEGRDMDGSFMRLFRFISGTNASGEKIAMTTPVLIEGGEGKRAMSFIVPTATVEKGVPAPKAESVSVSQRPAARWATLRFGGKRSTETETKAATDLADWMKAQSLVAKGAPRFAYYDPPWTPSFLRRNEVMVPIE